MNSEPLTGNATPGSSSSGSGLVKPDAGIDPGRADYSETNIQAEDRQGASHDFDNVETPFQDPADNNVSESVGERQMRVITRIPG